MKNDSFVQWFISLVEQDMSDYEEDTDTKQQVYQAVKQEILDKGKGVEQKI